MFLISNSGTFLSLLVLILHCSPYAQDQPPPDEGNDGIQEDPIPGPSSDEGIADLSDLFTQINATDATQEDLYIILPDFISYHLTNYLSGLLNDLLIGLSSSEGNEAVRGNLTDLLSDLGNQDLEETEDGSRTTEEYYDTLECVAYVIHRCSARPMSRES